MVYIGSFRSHWGHFLVDLVPRLWYVLEHKNDNIDAYVISGEFHGSEEIQITNIKEFLECFGILDMIMTINIPTKFKSVIIPERAYCFGKAISDSCEKHIFSYKYLDVFNYITNRVLENYGKQNKERVIPQKIFMTRNTNFDCGIELLNNFFENNGYMVVDPAEISLIDLIVFLNGCETVAYISGTLQHNMLFAPNGMHTVAIESRTYISPIQIDIDMIKDIHATYIDANYGIVKDFWAHSRLYGYTDCFKRYSKDMKKVEPDAFYQGCEFLWGNIRKYLRSYQLPNVLRFEYLKSDYSGYENTVYQESIAEISCKLDIDIDIKYSTDYNRESVSIETSELLETLRVPYSKWNENTYGDIYQTFRNLIRFALQQREIKRIMIYPYGKNGLVCKLILKELYEIEPIIFDNEVCQYNTSVFSLRNAEQVEEKEGVFILTSATEECVKEVKKYSDMKMIFGPYTVY